jgi:hypothetical protein
MQDYSLEGVTNSDVDTQVILGMMKGRSDSNMSNDKHIPSM